MDCSSYFTLRTGSINYIPAPILKVRSAKPPAKPPEIIHSLHVDDLRALVVNMNDYYEEESSLLSFSDLWKCKRGVHKFVQVMAVDGSFVYDKGKGHKYNTKNDLKIYEHLVQDIGELKFCVFPHMLYILFGFKDVILKLAWLGKPPPLPPEICHNGSAHIGNDISISEEKASRRTFEVRSNPNFLDGLETYSHLLVLYISREMLHKNQILKVIRENLTKKCIKMFLEIAQNKRGYFKYFETFSMNLKLGVHEDNWNKTKLAGLLLHYSTKSGDEMKNLKLRRQMAQFNDVTDNFGLFFPSTRANGSKVDLYVDVVKHWELAIVAFTLRSRVTGSLLLLMLLNTGSSLAPQLYHLVGAVSNPKKLVAATTDGYKVPNNIGIVHSLLMRVDNMGDEYVVFQFETAFFILGFSLVDPAFQVCCCVNKFYIFSSPRPPEVADLEDKVNFKEEGMLRNGISRNLRELFVFWYNLTCIRLVVTKRIIKQ